MKNSKNMDKFYKPNAEQEKPDAKDWPIMVLLFHSCKISNLGKKEVIFLMDAFT